MRRRDSGNSVPEGVEDRGIDIVDRAIATAQQSNRIFEFLSEDLQTACGTGRAACAK